MTHYYYRQIPGACLADVGDTVAGWLDDDFWTAVWTGMVEMNDDDDGEWRKMTLEQKLVEELGSLCSP